MNEKSTLKEWPELNDKYPEVFAFSTTKALGSMGSSDSDRNTTNQNRKSLAEKLDIPVEKLIFAKQVHGRQTTIVDDSFAGKAHLSGKEIPNTDALLTNSPGVCIAIRTSDCTPIILYDYKRRAAAVIHAGRMGTVAKIAQNTVETMQKAFDSNPKNITAVLGPAIGPCCYEISTNPENNVIAEVKKAFPNRHSKLLTRWHNQNTQAYFDLWEANRVVLEEAGVQRRNIKISRLCTHCGDQYFSARRKEKANFATGIIIAKD